MQKWARLNKLTINMSNTKEMVFHRLSPRCLMPPPQLSNIERVLFAKLLGVYVSDTLGAGKQIEYMLKTCNQRLYLLNQLKKQDCLSKNSIMFSML